MPCGTPETTSVRLDCLPSTTQKTQDVLIIGIGVVCLEGIINYALDVIINNNNIFIHMFKKYNTILTNL